ncbi:MAG: hypothetical protein NZ845_01320 [Thermodesulfovibrio sp.]|nr:hypothetical protein [Thermodesulfovibrio sp.]
MEKVIFFPFIGSEKLSKFSKEEFQEIREKFNEIIKDYPGVMPISYIDSCMVTKIAWNSAVKKFLISKESR